MIGTVFDRRSMTPRDSLDEGSKHVQQLPCRHEGTISEIPAYILAILVEPAWPVWLTAGRGDGSRQKVIEDGNRQNPVDHLDWTSDGASGSICDRHFLHRGLADLQSNHLRLECRRYLSGVVDDPVHSKSKSTRHSRFACEAG